MKIDDVLEIHNQVVMNENKNLIIRVFDGLKNLKWATVKSTWRIGFGEFSDIVKAAGLEKEVVAVINRYLGTKFKNLDSIKHLRVIESKSNGGLKGWWEEAAGNLYNALSFYPILTMFLELDKIIRGMDGDVKVATIYGLMWVGIVSGKVAKDVLSDRKERKKPVQITENITGTMKKMVDSVKGLTYRDIKYKSVEGFKNFADLVTNDGFEDEVLYVINSTLATRFNSLENITNLRIIESGINEFKIKDWWEKNTSDLYKNMTLTPFKKMYTELMSIMRGTGGNTGSVVFYAVLWVLMATGKLVVNKMRG